MGSALLGAKMSERSWAVFFCSGRSTGTSFGVWASATASGGALSLGDGFVLASSALDGGRVSEGAAQNTRMAGTTNHGSQRHNLRLSCVRTGCSLNRCQCEGVYTSEREFPRARTTDASGFPHLATQGSCHEGEKNPGRPRAA